jgi:hypothetical protein
MKDLCSISLCDETLAQYSVVSCCRRMPRSFHDKLAARQGDKL